MFICVFLSLSLSLFSCSCNLLGREDKGGIMVQKSVFFFVVVVSNGEKL
jgi:hypothetical protein